MDKDQAIQRYMTTKRWAMQPTVLNSLCAVVERHLSGQKLSDEQIAQVVSTRRSADDGRKYEVLANGTAVIPVTGIIAKYSSMVNNVSQPEGTSCEFLSEQLTMALDDKRVRRILLRIESPGGSMAGLPDLADKVYNASFVKPVIAFADDQADSAAYWIGSQANAFYANQSAMVGSIGVYMVIPDSSRRAEMFGVKFNVVKSGAMKGAAYPGSEVTDAQLAVFQHEINADHAMFLNAVLRGRLASGLSMAVLETLADGREYAASAAVETKLIDGIMTLDAVLALEGVKVRETMMKAAASADSEPIGKETIMPETKNQQTAQPDAAAEDKLRAALEADRVRVQSIRTSLVRTEYAEVVDKAIAGGWSLEQAKAAAFDIANPMIDSQVKAGNEKNAVLQQRLDAIAKSGHAEALVSQPETTPDKPVASMNPAAGNAETFQKAVDANVKSGLSQARAITRAVKTCSKADYQAWILASQKTK